MNRLRTFLFKNKNTKQIVAKNTTWLFVGEIGMRLLKLIIFIYAARTLGANEWGIFSYSLAVMSVFGIISDIGMNAVLLRETAKKHNSEQYIATGFFLKLTLSVISSLALLSLLFFLNTNAVRILIPITAVMLFLDSMREFGFAISRAFEKMEVEAMIKIIGTGVLVVFGLIFISRHATALSLAYAYVVGGIIGVTLMFFSIRSHLANLGRPTMNILMSFLKEGWPLAVVSTLGIVMINIDTIILGWFKDAAEIGIYAAAQKPIQILFVIPGLISTALLPLFSRLVSSNKEHMRIVLDRSINFSIGIALPIAIMGFILGGPIILLLFGTQYAAAIIPFKIMSLAVITVAPGTIMSNAIFAEGRQKYLVQVIAVGVLVNIIICLTLIPRFGLYGASIAITGAQLLANAFMILIVRNIPTLRFTFQIKRIVFACGAMLLTTYLLIPFTHPIGVIVAAGMTYLVTLIIIKEPLVTEIWKIVKP